MLRSLIVAGASLVSLPVSAEDLALPVTIETARGRIEVTAAPIDHSALPAASCLPGCVLPATIGNVTTLTEAEVLAFLTNDLASGGGVVIDPRLPEAHAMGALPGAVNLPLPTLARDNPYLGDVLRALGAAAAGEAGTYDFSAAKVLLIHGNGPWADEGAGAVQALLDLGYPADKLRFYRGGIRDWMLTGLALALPAVQG